MLLNADPPLLKYTADFFAGTTTGKKKECHNCARYCGVTCLILETCWCCIKGAGDDGM